MDMSRFLPSCLALALVVSSSSLMAQADKEAIRADIDDGYAEIDSSICQLNYEGKQLQSSDFKVIILYACRQTFSL